MDNLINIDTISLELTILHLKGFAIQDFYETSVPQDSLYLTKQCRL